MSKSQKLKLPKWVPAEAQARLADLHELPGIAQPTRAVIGRLASRLEMQNFWNNWPDRLKGREAEIVSYAVIAFEKASDIKPPPPFGSFTKMREYVKDYGYPRTVKADIPFAIDSLLTDITEIESRARSQWSTLWWGRSDLTYDDFISTLRAAAWFYHHVQDSAQTDLEAMQFPPPPRKLDSRTVCRRWFCRAMADLFKRLCGRPLYERVATLTSVAFDLKEGFDAGQARSACRSAAAD